MLYVLDASAILNDFSFSFILGNQYVVTSAVFAELKDMRSRNLADNALQRETLKIIEPEKQFSEKAEQMVEKHGFEISKADISILALAMELREKHKKFEVVTDDYSLQNFLKLLKIQFSGVIHGRICKARSLKKKQKQC